MVVSKSVSVSKVSVKMGDVTEQGERGDLNNLETFLDPALYDAYGVASLPIVNPRATDQSQLSMRPTDQSQHPEMLLRSGEYFANPKTLFSAQTPVIQSMMILQSIDPWSSGISWTSCSRWRQ